MKNVGYVLIAVLILLVMITVHEAGHYFVGKIFKNSKSTNSPSAWVRRYSKRNSKAARIFP